MKHDRWQGLPSPSLSRTCLQCGTPFTAHRAAQMFHTRKCKNRYYEKHRAELARTSLDRAPFEFANAAGAAPERVCKCGGAIPPGLRRCVPCETDIRVGRALRAEAKKKAAPKERQRRLDAHTVLTPAPARPLSVEE